MNYQVPHINFYMYFSYFMIFLFFYLIYVFTFLSDTV
uniref:ATPase subunit 8 n=1 Tax=Styela clava TaxID=7725 RepID=A0A024HWC9_STYCL|nr:ATP synthase F0 subunit 8 [Styela clava]CDM98931.1 ATPase subunit 8 [Styela clava]